MNFLEILGTIFAVLLVITTIVFFIELKNAQEVDGYDRPIRKEKEQHRDEGN